MREDPPCVPLQLLHKVGSPGPARLERDVGNHVRQFACGSLCDDCGIQDALVLEQHILHLQRQDQLAAYFEAIIAAADVIVGLGVDEA